MWRGPVSSAQREASDAAAQWGHGVQTGSNGQQPRRRGTTDLLRCLGRPNEVAVKQEADRVCGDALPVAEGVHELPQRRGMFALEVDLVAVIGDHLEVDVLASLFLLLVPLSTAGHCRAAQDNSSVPAASTLGGQAVRFTRAEDAGPARHTWAAGIGVRGRQSRARAYRRKRPWS